MSVLPEQKSGLAGGLRMVDLGDLPDYPLPAAFRMPTHYFFPWWHNRWLNSTLHLAGSYEVQGVAVALYSIAQNQAPVGTLPCDDALIARLLRMDSARWADLCRAAVSPLHGWFRCNCEGEVRWAHPVVLEIVLAARDRREERELSKEERAAAKRVERLRAALAEMGLAEGLVKNRAFVEEVDFWLVEHCKGRRTAMWYGRVLDWAASSGLIARAAKSGNGPHKENQGDRRR